MNKYPVSAPQQYSDYEDDDGPGLGTLGAALAAGALLTPIGRPVRALAKKGLGAADDMLGGYGARGIGKLRDASVAAKEAMFGTKPMYGQRVGNAVRNYDSVETKVASALNKPFSPTDFSLDALIHNLKATGVGAKAAFVDEPGKWFADPNVMRNAPLPVDVDVLQKATRRGGKGAPIQEPLDADVLARAMRVNTAKPLDEDVILRAALAKELSAARNKVPVGSKPTAAAAKPEGQGFVPPTAVDRIEQVKAESMADYVDALEKRLGYKEAKGLGVVYDTDAPKIEDLYKELKLPLRKKEEMAHQANVIHNMLNSGGKATLEDVKAALIAMQQPNARGLSGSIKDIVSKRLAGG